MADWLPSTKQTLTIAASGTTSDWLNLASLGKTGPWVLTIFNYDTGPFTGEITFEVRHNETDTDQAVLQSGGADVTIAASKAVVTDPINAASIRLISSLAEAATRTFYITGSLRD